MVASATNPTFVAATPLGTDRDQAASVLRADGKVFVIGGEQGPTGSTSVLSSTEIYDPVGNTWTPDATLPAARQGASAILLGGGDVLVCGGKVGTSLSTHCERFSASTDSFADTVANGGTAFAAKSSMQLFSNGQVMVAGGNALFLYDPTSGGFSQPGNFPSYHGSVSAAAGGSVYVYDPVLGDVIAFSDPNTDNDLGALGFVPGTAGVLGSGEIVFVAPNGTSALLSPPGGFTSLPNVPNNDGAGVLVPSANGNLILVGSGTGEVYALQESNHQWSDLGALSAPRTGGSAVMLSDNRVIYAGGRTTANSLATVTIIGQELGDACLFADQCLSGFCANGNCCSSACSGPCTTCSTGTCNLLAAGSVGQCGPGTAQCPETCAEDGGCNPPRACIDGGPVDAGPPDGGCNVLAECPMVDAICAPTACTNNRCIYPSGTCGTCMSCHSGACQLDPLDTDPNNTCGGTVGACHGLCDGDGGCFFPTGTCSDNDVCTTGEHCVAGACTGGTPVANCCHTASDCINNDVTCAGACLSNRCSYPDAGTVCGGGCHHCDTGSCIEDDTLSCTDNNACTPNDHCASGVCVSDPQIPPPTCCLLDSDCPPTSNICLRPSCAQNSCTTAPVPGCCLTDSDCVDPQPDTVARCVSNTCQFFFNVPDAGPVDAGPVDAGRPDAGHPDAGHPDAGHHDAGVDAGELDAGPTDAGVDAGFIDAGVDGGTSTKKKSSGCSCSDADDLTLLAWALPALLTAVSRRRRR
jgi:hypothetical protein